MPQSYQSFVPTLRHYRLTSARDARTLRPQHHQLELFLIICRRTTTALPLHPAGRCYAPHRSSMPEQRNDAYPIPANRRTGCKKQIVFSGEAGARRKDRRLFRKKRTEDVRGNAFTLTGSTCSADNKYRWKERSITRMVEMNQATITNL
jgi:hypothetical protein